MLLGDLTKGREATASRVGKENVEATLLALHGGIDTIEVCKVGDVTADASNVESNEFYGSVEFGLTAASDEDIRAFGHKPFGCGESDSAAAAGDQGDFSGKFVGAHDVGPSIFRWLVCHYVPYGIEVNIMDRRPVNDLFTYRYETRENYIGTRASPRFRRRESVRPRDAGFLAEGLPWHVAFRSHRCDGHQSSESLRRFW